MRHNFLGFSRAAWRRLRCVGRQSASFVPRGAVYEAISLTSRLLSSYE